MHISVHVLSPFMAVRLESLFNSHSNFMISVLCLDVAAPFNLFIYGDAALLTGSTRLSLASLPLTSSFQSSITRPLFPPHPYMHLYRGWIHEVHVLIMCSTSLLPDLSLSSPSMTHFSIHMMSPPVEPSLYTRTHAQTPLASHRLFFPTPCTVMVLVGLCVCALRTRCGEDSRYRLVSCCFDWLILSSRDAVEDVYEPEVPNRRLLPCSVWTTNIDQCTLSVHDVVTMPPSVMSNIQHTVTAHNLAQIDKGQHGDAATADRYSIESL